MAHGASGPPPPGKRWLWWISTFAAALSLILSYIAYWSILHEAGAWRSLEALYSSIELLELHVPYSELSELKKADPDSLLLLHFARILAVVFTGAAALALLWRFFGNEWRLSYRGWRGKHTVICGFGPVAKQLAREFSRHKPVIVEEHADSASVHELEPRAALLEGNPAGHTALKLTRAWNAARLFAATDNDGENIGIAVQAANLAKEKGTHPHILVHITDLQLRTSLRHNEAFHYQDAMPRLSMFNVYENSARLLFLRPGQELDHRAIRENDETVVQLILIGCGLMGEAVLTRAAMSAHFANLKLPRITVIDRHADKKRLLLLTRYPQLERVVDANFLEADAHQQAAQERIGWLCADTRKTISTVVISFDDDARALSLASMLLRRLPRDVPIRLRLNDHSGLADLPRPPQVTVFGSLHDACSREHWLDQKLDNMARAMHDVHRSSVNLAGLPRPSDRTMRDWEQLDDDVIDSNRQAADHISVKLRAVGCRIVERKPGDAVGSFTFDANEIELLAKMEHQRWMAERYLAGWSYGAKKDDVKLISPYLVPWEQIPDNIRDYDRVPVRILPDVVRKGGWEIVR